jgi:small-conductance mechanosensitive channel
MIFAHIVDDYYLQGILAKMKQKSWWEKNAPAELYKYDYIVALFMHAFSWSFMINLPTLLVSNDYILMCIYMVVNTLIHAWIDNDKANRHHINLITDQICHLIQIVNLWLVIVVL